MILKQGHAPKGPDRESFSLTFHVEHNLMQTLVVVSENSKLYANLNRRRLFVIFSYFDKSNNTCQT